MLSRGVGIGNALSLPTLAADRSLPAAPLARCWSAALILPALPTAMLRLTSTTGWLSWLAMACRLKKEVRGASMRCRQQSAGGWPHAGPAHFVEQLHGGDVHVGAAGQDRLHRRLAKVHGACLLCRAFILCRKGTQEGAAVLLLHASKAVGSA